MSEQLGMTFAEAASIASESLTPLFGGKGAGLVKMVGMGLPVPPGFTLTTEACRRYLDQGWTPDLDRTLSTYLGRLERDTGKGLGDAGRPLLVSVRSGAPVSMPGMMDTVLNAGMTPEIARALGAATGDARFGWDTYRRFVQSYVTVVLGAPAALVRELSESHLGADDGASLSPDDLARAALALQDGFAARGLAVPADPHEQVRGAVGAVFASWNCERARTYRRLENIPEDLFTAATVQMMAFGNLGERSGTGVAFSRDPSSGEAVLMGDFLQAAQGEDVVAGTHQTLPITALADLWPDIGAELARTARLLERDLCDLADIEFTVENGAFWLLQYRKGKHSPRAALRMAIEMAEDPDFPLSRAEALARVESILSDPPKLAVEGQAAAPDAEVIATGLPASPGLASGRLCTSVDEAVAAEGRGEAVILVRRETSPSDIAGMAASVGILTTRGGHVSHAAVVARGWGLPAVVGAKDIELDAGGIRIGERCIAAGTEITIDGTSGEVFLGMHRCDEVEVPEVAILRAWQRESPGETPQVDAGGYTEDITVDSVSRALVLKGMGDAAAIAGVLGGSEAAVAEVIADLVAQDRALAMPGGRVRPDAVLNSRIDARYAEDAARLKDRIEPEMKGFHVVNDAFKSIVTDWQMREVDGAQVMNDHSDPDYDRGVIRRIETEVHGDIVPILDRVSAAEPRLARYRSRLERALERIGAGETDMVAHPMKDSYHTVWFELHEELIRLSGLKRTE